MSWKKRYLSFSEEEESPARKACGAGHPRMNECSLPVRTETIITAPQKIKRYEEPSCFHPPYRYNPTTPTWTVAGSRPASSTQKLMWPGNSSCSPVNVLLQQQLEFYRRQLEWSYSPLPGPILPLSPSFLPAPIDLSMRSSTPTPPSRSDHCLDLSMSTRTPPLQTFALDQDTEEIKTKSKLLEQSISSQPNGKRTDSPAATIFSKLGPSPSETGIVEKFTASLKNGELVPDVNGHLVVTHIVEVMEKEIRGGQQEQEGVSNDKTKIKKERSESLSFERYSVIQEAKSQADIKKEKCSEATVPKLTIKLSHVRKVEPPSNDTASANGLPENIQDNHVAKEVELVADIRQKMEASKKPMVLWYFLRFLLDADTELDIIRWSDRSGKRFTIVDPDKLARLWARLKENPSMDWTKLQKVLELYLRKNFIKASGQEREYIFTNVQQM